MKLIATQLAQSERWLNEVNQRAWRCRQRMTARERQATELAYSQTNERAWDIADNLLRAVDSPIGERYKRIVLVKELEALTDGN